MQLSTISSFDSPRFVIDNRRSQLLTNHGKSLEFGGVNFFAQISDLATIFLPDGAPLMSCHLYDIGYTINEGKFITLNYKDEFGNSLKNQHGVR